MEYYSIDIFNRNRKSINLFNPEMPNVDLHALIFTWRNEQHSMRETTDDRSLFMLESGKVWNTSFGYRKFTINNKYIFNICWHNNDINLIRLLSVSFSFFSFIHTSPSLLLPDFWFVVYSSLFKPKKTILFWPMFFFDFFFIG